MNNRKNIPSALVIASCIFLPAFFLAACDLSESDSPGSDVPADEKPDENGIAVGSILYTQRFLRHDEGGSLVPATASDFLADVVDANGNTLGLEVGDKISFSGTIGGGDASGATPLVYTEGASGTTLQDLIDKIRENFKLPEHAGTSENNLPVAMNPPGSDDGIPDGAIVIRCLPGKEFAIKDVSIRSSDVNNLKPSPSFFNTNMNIATFRKAADAEAVVKDPK